MVANRVAQPMVEKYIVGLKEWPEVGRRFRIDEQSKPRGK